MGSCQESNGKTLGAATFATATSARGTSIRGITAVHVAGPSALLAPLRSMVFRSAYAKRAGTPAVRLKHSDVDDASPRFALAWLHAHESSGWEGQLALQTSPLSIQRGGRGLQTANSFPLQIREPQDQRSRNFQT